MVNICFKRAKHTDKAGLFHPDYIIEQYDETAFPSGSFPTSDNWESLSEDMFLEEFAKNEALQEAHLEKKSELDRLRENQLRRLELKSATEEKQLLREFEAFKRWRKK